MTSEERREKIKFIWKEAIPLTGTYLASLFNVSRQIIVQDMQFFGRLEMIYCNSPRLYYAPEQPAQTFDPGFAVKHSGRHKEN